MLAEVNGISLHYDVSGSGETIVLIGGFGANRRFWNRMVPLLDGYRVVTLDNRGVGETEYDGDFSIDDMADDVIALMDHLSVDMFHVLGWSMGSHIAQSLGIRHGDRLMSLTLVSTYLRRPSRSEYILGTLTRMAAEGLAPVECLAIAVNAFCFPESTFRELEDKGETVSIPKRLERPEGLMDQLKAIRAYDTTGIVSGIRVPTLLIHGTEDIMVEISVGHSVADRIPGCEVLDIEGAGHNIPPEEYSEQFLEFIGKQGAR